MGRPLQHDCGVLTASVRRLGPLRHPGALPRSTCFASPSLWSPHSSWASWSSGASILLDRELIRLLNHSQESFENLNRLQAQILQSEKLASIGQLVGGAAHELNNPITAMLGYSDMLLSTPLTDDQRPLAAKIGQYVRRTKSLVASLISFARQAPAPKSPLDLNTLARTAVKLTQSQWEALGIEVRTQFDPALAKVLGDSNQLLQVCLQLVASCLHVLSERGGRVLTVSTVGQTRHFRPSNRHRRHVVRHRPVNRLSTRRR